MDAAPRGAAQLPLETGLRVPGLGVLALPAGPLPPWLEQLPLHAAVPAELRFADGVCFAATATVEELTRDGRPRRALLLDADPGRLVTAGAVLTVWPGAPAPGL